MLSWQKEIGELVHLLNCMIKNPCQIALCDLLDTIKTLLNDFPEICICDREFHFFLISWDTLYITTQVNWRSQQYAWILIIQTDCRAILYCVKRKFGQLKCICNKKILSHCP